MIISVKIAPVEYWCEEARALTKEYPEMLLWSGRTIKIETLSMRRSEAHCGSDEWEVVESDIPKPPWFVPGAREWVCRPFLEMD
jgi:hypothetical protein